MAAAADLPRGTLCRRSDGAVDAPGEEWANGGEVGAASVGTVCAAADILGLPAVCVPVEEQQRLKGVGGGGDITPLAYSRDGGAATGSWNVPSTPRRCRASKMRDRCASCKLSILD